MVLTSQDHSGKLGFGPISVRGTVIQWQWEALSLTCRFPTLWPGRVARDGLHGMGLPTREGTAGTGRVLDRHEQQSFL